MRESLIRFMIMLQIIPNHEYKLVQIMSTHYSTLFQIMSTHVHVFNINISVYQWGVLDCHMMTQTCTIPLARIKVTSFWGHYYCLWLVKNG